MFTRDFNWDIVFNLTLPFMKGSKKKTKMLINKGHNSL